MIRVIILALLVAGCSPPQTEAPEPVQKSVKVRPKVRPNPVLRTELAWYYCDKDKVDPAFIMLSRAAIIDGIVQTPRDIEIKLDWMGNCKMVAEQLHQEISSRERLE